ncbi:hypothetical protein LTR85_004144 [Meristemomyces frigidus]|nr:hypothetical protein LTR85_004144 [Meristemomyces frigidus]
MPVPHPDAIADCVLAAFHALPAKCKPRKLADGKREWAVLTGDRVDDTAPSCPPGYDTTSASTAAHYEPSSQHSPKRYEAPTLFCAALATGMKCLPQSKIPLAKGNVLHDWHAEVLAIRGFNMWLVDECQELARRGMPTTRTEGEGENKKEGAWVGWRRRGAGRQGLDGHDGEQDSTACEQDLKGTGESGSCSTQRQVRKPPFAVLDDVQIHMYCSEAPCGDASMELTMAEQEDATPWTQPPAEDSMLGRGNFDQLGVVRRKPARPDAPPTLSKSCSDKLAMKQCTSILSSVTSLLVRPDNAYLRTLVLPGTRCVHTAVERAFGREGRMNGVAWEELQGQWREAGYAFTPFEVMTTAREFEYSKNTTGDGSCSHLTEAPAPVPSNLSGLYTPKRLEVLVNGVLQGRKQNDPRGASCVSRRRMWEAACAVAEGFSMPAGLSTFGSYEELKNSKMLAHREKVKLDVRRSALKGWKKNVGDEEWSLG